jgi:outer membrane protein TolC
MEMQRGRGYLTALAVLAALLFPGATGVVRAQEGPPESAGSAPAIELPPALPETSGPVEVRPAPAAVSAVAVPPARPIRLADALAMSLRNVETVQANLSVRTAAVARFEAMKAFVPLVNLPTFAVGLTRLTGSPKGNIIFPDVTGGTPFIGQPGLSYANINRVNIFLPLDPSGQITALPIAEEGIRGKELMEQLVRRSQAVMAAQRYFEAKQVQYRLGVAYAGADLAGVYVGYFERRLREQQAHDVEVSQARVDVGRARVLLSNIEKESAITQRRLGVAVHQCRLLVPLEVGPAPIESDWRFTFDLASPDTVDLRLVPDFPCSREQAVELARRQRLEVRLMVVGTRIAELQNKRDKLRLFGMGQLPLGLAFKNTNPNNGGVALGLIFGALYDLPVTDVVLWSKLRQAKLDVMLSQINLERAMLETAEDAGTSWDRWQQAIREWEQKEAEYRLRIEYRDRVSRLFQEKQAIRLDLSSAEVDLLQADADRWTAWYNLQLARLDILRATELLLDFIEKAGITTVPHVDDAPRGSAPRHGFFRRMAQAGRSGTSDRGGG